MKNLSSAMLQGISLILNILVGINWGLAYIYVFFMIIDVLTGWEKAVKNGEYKSKIMKEGLKGKALELLIVFGIIFMQGILEKSFGIMILSTNILLLGFAFKEFMSIMENWVSSGKEIPKTIENWLAICKKTIDNMSNIDKDKEE